jgi:DNA-binding NtrC family response regulator
MVGEAAAALLRVGHLDRLHTDEAALFPVGAGLGEAITEIRFTRAPHDDCRLEGETLLVECADPFMSAPHASIAVRRGARGTPPSFRLTDAGSRNGIFVRGRGRVASHDLGARDEIVLGRTVFVFHGQPIKNPDALVQASLRPFGPTRSISPALLAAWQTLDRAAPSELTVLLTGDTGTGKEITAQEIHARSRRKGRLVAVNCGALAEGLIEGQLFGYRRGAFTGAQASSPGFVAAAEGGTLFLDEITDMPLPAQTKLLRVLEERMVIPLGEVAPRPVDVRIIAASQQDLRRRVADGKFRNDLYARLSQIAVELPRLADRREDLGILVAHFCAQAGAELTLPAARALLAYDWPLNTRELATALRAAAVLAERAPQAAAAGATAPRVIDVEHLPASLRAAPGPAGAAAASAPPAPVEAPPGTEAPSAADDGVDRYPGTPGRAELQELLARHGGNVTAAARAVDKGKMQLYRWLARRGIDPRTFRSGS